jgi:putative DNA primase/helicase
MMPTTDAAGLGSRNGDGSERHRPSLDAGDLNMARAASHAWAVLAVANDPPFLFRFGGVPSRIEIGDDLVPMIRPLTVDRVRHALAHVADFFVMPRNGGMPRDALPPEWLARDMLARPDPPLPLLTRLVEAPVFGPDGDLAHLAGYHRGSRTYYAPARALAVPTVSAAPTSDEIGRARRLLLEDLLGDFPFTGDAEQAHALALVLLPFVRDLIDGPTPLHIVEKPMPGTGGTLLVHVCLYPALGRPVPAMTEGRDEDEWRKRLTAKLLAGSSVVFIDNLKRRLDSPTLASVITAGAWEDRILGRTEVTRLPVRCLWIGSGNNPGVSTEIARRCVRIRLDARVDRPWLRDGFRHPDLLAWAAAHRGELVWAAATLVRAWVAAGRPIDAPTLGMFESWAGTLGGILAVAGVPGFLQNRAAFYDAADSQSPAIRRFLGAWWDRYRDAPTLASDLFALALDADLDIDAKSDHGRRIRLGRLLADQRDRHYRLDDGALEVRVTPAGERARAVLWRLEYVSESESRNYSLTPVRENDSRTYKGKTDSLSLTDSQDRDGEGRKPTREVSL